MPKKFRIFKNDTPKTQNGGEISKKWKRCDVLALEKVCDFQKQKSLMKKRKNKEKKS